MFVRKMLFPLLACMGLISCSKDGKRLPSEPDAAKYTLTVSLSEGVGGSPGAGSHTYHAGESVPYSFAAKSGYKHLSVELDQGRLVKDAGNITMTGNVKVFVHADAVQPVIPEAMPITASVVGYAQQTDSLSALAAYNTYASNLGKLYQTEPDNALAIAEAGYVKALETLTDADLERTEKFLSSQLFGPSQATSQGAGPNMGKSTSLIYVNGILNSSAMASLGRHELERVVSEAGLSGSIDVYNFYNASAKYDQDAKRKCIRHALERASYLVYMLCGAVTDLVESQRQVANIIGTYSSQAEPEAKALAKIIGEERAKGHAVILGGHSQGNLMIAQALKKLGSVDPCIKVFSLAAPLGAASWQPMLPAEDLEGFAVAGERAKDIILALGLNDLTRIETDSSKAADERVNILSNPNLAVSYSLVEEIFEDIHLHSLTESYLSGAESRARVKEIIKKQAGSIAQNAGCQIASGVRIYAIDGNLNGGFIAPPSRLWSVGLSASGKDSLIAEIHTADGTKVLLTDVAESPSGELLGISEDALYVVNKSDGLIEPLTYFSSSSTINALAVDSQGRIYLADGGGDVVGLDRSSLKIFWRGSLGYGFGSAGDIAFSPSGELFAIGQDYSGTNFLLRLDAGSTDAKVVGKALTTTNIFGLAFVGNTLIGLSADGGTDTGKLEIIDQATGQETFIRKLSFDAFGAARKVKKF